MWKIEEIESTGNNVKFSIFSGDSFISNLTFLELLRDNKTFRSFYNRYLAVIGFDAFFWENKPMTKANLDEVYECNVINSEYLAQKSPDFQTFSSYFIKDEEVVSFPNLGKDARLVAPCPVSENNGYAHIGTFIREAPEAQKQQLWKQTAEEMLNQVRDETKWLSTSGLGVFWLHIRIDSVPKYYQTKEYKRIN